MRGVYCCISSVANTTRTQDDNPTRATTHALAIGAPTATTTRIINELQAGFAVIPLLVGDTYAKELEAAKFLPRYKAAPAYRPQFPISTGCVGPNGRAKTTLSSVFLHRTDILIRAPS